MKLINIGFGNLVSQERVVAIVSPDSAPIKRMVQESRERGMLIDATYGRKTASILVMDSDHVILSALAPEKFGMNEDKGEAHTGEREKHSSSPAPLEWERARFSRLCWSGGRTSIFLYPPLRASHARESWMGFTTISWTWTPSANGFPWSSSWSTQSM